MNRKYYKSKNSYWFVETVEGGKRWWSKFVNGNWRVMSGDGPKNAERVDVDRIRDKLGDLG